MPLSLMVMLVIVPVIWSSHGVVVDALTSVASLTSMTFGFVDAVTFGFDFVVTAVVWW